MGREEGYEDADATGGLAAGGSLIAGIVVVLRRMCDEQEFFPWWKRDRKVGKDKETKCLFICILTGVS